MAQVDFACSVLGFIKRLLRAVLPALARDRSILGTKEQFRAQIDAALEKEAAAILAKLPKGGKVVALCVEGKPMSSEKLAETLDSWAVGGASQLTFLIGGSYGMHESVKARADLRLSMSPMTFPHHLARVMVLEQIYRAFKINEGSSYHK
jgi:23S rRNA (pseudouridine1915-N3)-methyltransferase